MNWIQSMNKCVGPASWDKVTTDNSATLQNTLAEIERFKAECERHIQEVDASREAIERKDAALRVALAELERLDKDSPFPIGVKAIPIIKEAL